MISEDAGIRPGNINYHFHTKEDMLYMLVQELMDFHGELVENFSGTTADCLVVYATEVASQIALCETNEKAIDLYYSAYTLSGVYEYIKEWTAKKNYRLLGKILPDWTYDDFRIKENVASAIEFSAFTSPTDRQFTLDDKVALILDTILKVYDVPKEERENVINNVLKSDYRSIGTGDVTVKGTITVTGYGFELEIPHSGGVVYYTTDATTPNKNSEKYEAPIRITEDTVVRAVVWTDGDCYSDVYEYDIKLNGHDIYFKEGVEKGSLINGYPDSTFRPDNAITRAEAIAIISRVFLFDADGTTTQFTVIPSDHWAFGYIAN